MSPRRTFVLALVLASVTPAGAAWANGAFPDSLQILLPADRPQQIVLATNFGLIISDDGGVTWNWTCEQKETAMGGLYAVGPSPQDRFYSLSVLTGLAYSDDASCSWQVAGGALDLLLARDVFPDPTDAAHVLAIASMVKSDGDGTAYQLLESVDGGATFGSTPLYMAPDTGTLTGVENARTDPSIIYAALYTTTTTAPSLHPKLIRTMDGGANWETLDLEPMLGATKFRIIAVDPADPMTLYLRVIDVDHDRELVAVSRDGGLTFATPITVDGGVISAFARLASGTVLVTGLLGSATGATQGTAWRSSDGGVTFQAWTLSPQPHLRALAERGGKVYAAAKNYTDGWAIGVSTDEGGSFTPLTTYDKVSGIRDCAKAVCADPCDFVSSGGVWPAAVCHPGADAGADAGGRPPGKSGCGCGVAARGGGGDGDGGGAGASLAVAGVALALTLARQRRRHRR